MSRLVLEIVTPTGIALRKDVDYVVVPTVDGPIGILPGHIRLMTKLTTGVLRYKLDDQDHFMAVSEGFMEVTPHKVNVLAEAADLPENIDAEQALADKREAEEAMHRSLNEKMNFTQAALNLERALAKLQVAKKYGDTK